MAVDVPHEMEEHIEGFDFVLGAPAYNKLICSLVGYKERTVFSVNKATPYSGFEDTLGKVFHDAGIEFDIVASDTAQTNAYEKRYSERKRSVNI